jgi:predicted O-methyltransferase YrrM
MTKTELIKKAIDLGIEANADMTVKEIESLISANDGESFAEATTFKGYGVVWDAENNSPLCEFIDGEFITDDTRITNILTDLGYEII